MKKPKSMIDFTCGTHSRYGVGAIAARGLPLLIVACLAASTAWASGADQIIYGSEAIADRNNDTALSATPLENEAYLYGNSFYSKRYDSTNEVSGEASLSGEPVEYGEGTLSSAPVPEPATGLLLGIGVLALARMIRRKMSASPTEG